MDEKDIVLSSVHWSEGMLLTPEHLVRQEQYFDSTVMWLARYATDAYGLVGIGARGYASERGAARFDPLIYVEDHGETLEISVTQCRGISYSGDIIEIDPSNPLHQTFRKAEIEGVQELGVYIVCKPHDKTITEDIEDPANPQIKSVRRQAYQLKLDVKAVEAPHSLMISRLQRAEGSLRYEKLSGFIPMCTTMLGHSELKRAWDRLCEQIISLADRYMQLHKAVVEYIALAGPRSINTREDEETLQFVGRMVMTLETAAAGLLNPLQSPPALLQQLHGVIRSAAVYLDLSPPTHDYFRQLAQVGVTEFQTLLEQERQTLLDRRARLDRDNLAIDLQRVELAFHRLQRLESALEGKYLDYRLSPALEALTFFFDRRSDSPALYQTISRPARPQLFGNEMTFIFAPLQLDARQTYRVVLIRDDNVPMEPGGTISTEVRINAGVGQGTTSLYPKAYGELPEQRNFAIDFEATRDVLTIQDVRVIVNTAHPIRSCLLYQRRRFIAQGSFVEEAAPRPIPPPPRPPSLEPSEEAARRRVAYDEPVKEAPEPNQPQDQPVVRRKRIEY